MKDDGSTLDRGTAMDLATEGQLVKGLVPGGTWLADFLYPPAARSRSVTGIASWWIERWIPYNLTVLATGAVTTTILALLHALPPGIDFWSQGILFPGAAIWMVLANICYSLGPVTETLLQKLWGRKLFPAGPLLWRAGITLAVGVTLLPLVPATIATIARVLGWD